MQFRSLITKQPISYLTIAAATILGANAQAITPKSNWADSYSANGKCYCATTYDHGIGNYKVDTPAGRKTVRQVCEKIGRGPGKGRNPVYNTVQCGHEPGHDDAIRINGRLVKDEKVCPGRVDKGSSGCNEKGPKWDLSVFGGGNNGGGNNGGGNNNGENGYKGKTDLPGRIEAEKYATAPSESTSGNKNRSRISNCTYYGLGVDVQDASEGTCNVGWTTDGEKLTYKVGDAGGSFDIRVRLASNKNGRRVRVEVNGDIAGTVSTNGSGWQAWANETISDVNIPNNATITVTFLDGSVNLNYLDITRASSSSSSSSSSNSSSNSSSSSSSSSNSSSSGSGNSACTNVKWRDRAEINLNSGDCISFDRNLSNKTLAVWDSDANASCDFRGTIKSIDGSGQVNVNSNYVSSNSLSGKSFRISNKSGNNCKFVKVRGY